MILPNRFDLVGVPEYTIGGKTKYHCAIVQRSGRLSGVGVMADVWFVDTNEARRVMCEDLRKWPKPKKKRR